MQADKVAALLTAAVTMRPSMTFHFRCLRIFGLLAAFSLVNAKAAQIPSESDLKAVFLFHFTKFVEWPATVFDRPDAEFVIGILGNDPFGPALDDIVRGEKVGRHPLVVRRVSGYPAESDCQILYVTKDAESSLDSMRINKAPVLTVGESPAFYEAGGLVEFITERRHIKLRVNLTAARSRSLVISAKLLRVAEVSNLGPEKMRYFEGEEAARLEFPRQLSKNGPLNLFAIGTRRTVFRVVSMKQVLAD
jgi:YfiR/HmsC-like